MYMYRCKYIQECSWLHVEEMNRVVTRLCTVMWVCLRILRHIQYACSIAMGQAQAHIAVHTSIWACFLRLFYNLYMYMSLPFTSCIVDSYSKLPWNVRMYWEIPQWVHCYWACAYMSTDTWLYTYTDPITRAISAAFFSFPSFIRSCLLLLKRLPWYLAASEMYMSP